MYRCLKCPVYFFNFLTLILIINIPHDVWIVYNIFINNHSLHECTCHCITYSVTAHPDDGQARSKHVGASNWEKMYNLCILLVFISNYTTMQCVEDETLVIMCFSVILRVFREVRSRYWKVYRRFSVPYIDQ